MTFDKSSRVKKDKILATSGSPVSGNPLGHVQVKRVQNFFKTNNEIIQFSNERTNQEQLVKWDTPKFKQEPMKDNPVYDLFNR